VSLVENADVCMWRQEFRNSLSQKKLFLGFLKAKHIPLHETLFESER